MKTSRNFLSLALAIIFTTALSGTVSAAEPRKALEQKKAPAVETPMPPKQQPAPAAQNKLKNLTLDGSLDMRMISLNNYTDTTNTVAATGANDDLREELRSRLMLRIGGNLTESIAAKIVLGKRDRIFGSAEQSVAVAALTNTTIRNAYLDLKDIPGVSLRIGRQFLGEPGDMVLYYGPTDNTFLNINAVDAIKADFRISRMDASVFYSKLADAGTAANVDTDLSGINLTYNELLPMINAKIYYYNRTIQNPVTSLMDGLGIVGLKTDIVKPVKNVNCKLEGALNLGTNYRGYAILFNGLYAYHIQELGKFTFALDFASGSGDDAATARNEGFVDIATDLRYGEALGKNAAGITNMQVIGADMNLAPDSSKSRLKAGIAGYLFKVNWTAAGISKRFGSEVDVRLEWLYTENTSLKFSAGIFLPSIYFSDSGLGTDPISQICTTLSLKF